MAAINIGANPLRDFTDPSLPLGGAIPAAPLPSFRGSPVPLPSPPLGGGGAPVAMPEFSVGGMTDRVREAVAGTERLNLDLSRFNTAPPTFTAQSLGLTGQMPRRVALPEIDMTGGPAESAGAPGGAAPQGAPVQSVPETTVTVPMTPVQRLEAFQVGALGTQEERLRAEAAGLEQTSARRRTAQEQALAAERAGLTGEEEQAQAEADVAIEEEQLARERVKQQRAALEETQAKYRGAQDALDNTKLDVDAAYGGAAGRLFAGLAVALGAFGARQTGGPNYALQIVNDRIGREIDAQRSEIEKKKGKVSELGRILERNERLLGDADAARKLTTAQTYQALRRNLTASNAVAAAGPRGQALLAELDQRTNDAMSQVRARIEDVGIRREGLPLEAAANRYLAQQELLRKQREAAAAAARGETAKALEFQREMEKIRAKGEEERATEATKAMIAEGGIPGMETAPGQPMSKKQEEALAKGSQTLVDSIEKLGVKQPVALKSTLDQLQGVLDKYEDEFSGMGGIARRGLEGSLPVVAQTDAYKNFEQGVLQAFLPYKTAMTGAAGADREMRMIEAAQGMRDPALLRNFLNQQREQLRRAEETASQAVPARIRPQVLGAFRTSTSAAAPPSTFKPYTGTP
jgi:hypothetical protein